MSNAKPNLMSRLEALEFQQQRVQAVEQLAVNLRRSTTTVVEMLNALVEELGGPELGAKIQTRLDDKRASVRKAEAERSASILKQLIEAGQVEPIGEITTESIIVGLESTPDDRIKDEALQMSFQQFNPDIQAELLGKSVGYVLEREGKKVLEVQAIYRMASQEPVKVTETPSEDPTQVVGGGTESPEAPIQEEAAPATVSE